MGDWHVLRLPAVGYLGGLGGLAGQAILWGLRHNLGRQEGRAEALLMPGLGALDTVRVKSSRMNGLLFMGDSVI